MVCAVHHIWAPRCEKNLSTPLRSFQTLPFLLKPQRIITSADLKSEFQGFCCKLKACLRCRKIIQAYSWSKMELVQYQNEIWMTTNTKQLQNCKMVKASSNLNHSVITLDLLGQNTGGEKSKQWLREFSAPSSSGQTGTRLVVAMQCMAAWQPPQPAPRPGHAAPGPQGAQPSVVSLALQVLRYSPLKFHFLLPL